MKDEMKKLQRIVNNFDTTSQEGRIMSREHARQFAEIERQIQEIWKMEDEKWQIYLEYESISVVDDSEGKQNLKLKDEKLNQILQTSRQKIRKQGELERNIKIQ